MKKTIQEIISCVSSNTVHLTFTSSSYLPIFNIWYEYLKKTTIQNLCVIALDITSFRELKKNKIPCVLMPTKTEINPKTKSSLWTQRLEVISGLINHDINVVHSDSDAFWLRDMMPYLNQQKEDLIFSIAYGMPKDVVKEWGFILCCGFFRINSNPQVKLFMADFLRKCYEINDDQRALNRLLLEKSVKWKLDSIIMNTGICDTYNITIKVIPKNIVARLPNKSLSVFHPFLSSTKISIKQKQAIYGLHECRPSFKSHININRFKIYNIFNSFTKSITNKVRS